MATEKRLDLIDRKNLIKAVEKKQFAIGDNTHPYEAIRIQGKYFREVVEGALTVDAVEVVHGRWKNVKETEIYSPDNRCTFTHTGQTCSVCNVRIGFIGAKFYLYDGYCPNCGAKMDMEVDK